MRTLVPARLLLMLSLVLGVGACSGTTDETDADTAATQRRACQELFGASGLKQIDRGVEGPEDLRFKSPTSLADARTRHHAQVRKWTPGSEPAPYAESHMCKIRTDISTGMQIGLTYKPSKLPFDAAFERRTETGIVLKPRLKQVNPDVKLVYGADEYREARYQVYVRCKVPGTPAGQEREVPMVGELTDTLTDSVGLRDHLSLLLHSARVVANTLDCQNKPIVPSALPASMEVS